MEIALLPRDALPDAFIKAFLSFATALLLMQDFTIPMPIRIETLLLR